MKDYQKPEVDVIDFAAESVTDTVTGTEGSNIGNEIIPDN